MTSSTKNVSRQRDHEMKQSKKAPQRYFGMEAHIGIGGNSGLVHTVRGTSGSVHDVSRAHALLHGEELKCFPMRLIWGGRKH